LSNKSKISHNFDISNTHELSVHFELVIISLTSIWIIRSYDNLETDPLQKVEYTSSLNFYACWT